MTMYPVLPLLAVGAAGGIASCIAAALPVAALPVAALPVAALPVAALPVAAPPSAWCSRSGSGRRAAAYR
jgi:hypothetical protein